MSELEIRRFCRACYMGSAIVTLLFGFVLIFVFFNRTSPMTYGGPITIEDTNGSSVISSGQDVKFCIHHASWNRLCRSETILRMTVGGVAVDFPTHTIAVPQHTGPLPEKKCREIHIPSLNITGEAKFTGFSRSTCWPTDLIWPLITDLPETTATLK